MQKKFLTTAAAIVLLCLGGMASAASATWTGDFSDDFMTQYNWAPEMIPVAADILSIGPGSYYQPLFNPGTGVTKTTTYVGVDAGGSLTITSGTLRITGNSSSECLFDRNGSITAGGTLINGGNLSTKNLYAGKGNNLGRITLTSGSIHVDYGSTTTLGYQMNSETTIGAVLNVWGGTADLGQFLRIDPVGAAAGKECSGIIDVRGTGMFFFDVNGVTLTTMNYLIGKGRIVSEPGYAPIAVDANNTIVPGKVKVLVTAQKVYYATGPSPAAIGGSKTFSAAQTLSWVKPFPRVSGDTVTSDVYFGTTPTPTTLVASNIAGSSITIPTVAEQTYYWKVDSRDSNGGAPIVTATPGNAWTFDTKITPVVTVGISNSRQVAFQRLSPDPNSDATLVATATDDGYPAALTYQWSAATGQDPNVTFIPSATVLNPSVVLNVVTAPNSSLTLPGATAATDYTDGNYHLLLTAYDGGANPLGYAVLTVKVYANPSTGSTIYCDAMKWVANSSPTYLAGDVTQDCTVDYKDLVTVALQWLVCNSLDCI